MLPKPQWDHPDLAANLVAATPEFKAAHNDDNGHGTHVAGIIGAVSWLQLLHAHLLGPCFPRGHHWSGEVQLRLALHALFPIGAVSCSFCMLYKLVPPLVPPLVASRPQPWVWCGAVLCCAVQLGELVVAASAAPRLQPNSA